ncbi:hypothetical protein BJ912DRAFT_956829 [Pholiota molesta]|nr:hypothetical protein BJ912DRAFT_956829 [Pholiota molesta]
MADPTAIPPRPRPRPRPVVKRTNDVSATATPDASSSSSSTIPLSTSGTRRVIQVQDTDEMFMRNRNRSRQTWQKLDQIDRAATKPAKEGSSDSDAEDTPRKSQNKRKKRDVSGVPAWRRTDRLTRLLSQDLSSNSDSDIEVLGGSSTPKGKRKRQQRSRSRSITPPPALPDYQVQAAKNVVRQALGAATARAPSPTLFDPDESTDTVIFQPELDAIAQEIAETSHRESSQAPADDVQDHGVEDHVVLTVIWHPHPLATNAQKSEWQYRIDRHDNFRELFDATADDANILTNNLVMTYQGKRFFPSVTPTFLKIYGDTAELAAYEKQAYEYIQKHPTALQHTNAPASPLRKEDDGAIEIESDAEREENNSYIPQTQTQDSEADSEAEGEIFKLILRSSGNKDITLTVRPTTKCGAIVKAFLNKLDVADQYPDIFADAPAKPAAKKRGRPTKTATVAAAAKDPRLCIDGDKMDNQTPIGDMDLEDGDMVEVVGL